MPRSPFLPWKWFLNWALSTRARMGAHLSTRARMKPPAGLWARLPQGALELMEQVPARQPCRTSQPCLAGTPHKVTVCTL